MFILIGVGFAIGAANYSLGTSARPGPGYFPLLLGVIQALLGAVVLFKSLTVETDGGDPVGAFAWRPLIVIMAAIVVFGFAMPRLGLILSIPILIAMVSLAGNDFRWKGVLATSVVLTIGSWAIFVLGLGLVLPLWPSFI